MSSHAKTYEYGILNPAWHSQKGPTLDPSNYSGRDWLRKGVEEQRNPNFIKKSIGGPLKAIAIYVEEHNVGDNTNLYNPDDDKPDSFVVRARIPELHAHIPDLKTYGPDANPGLVQMYPAFVSNEGAEKPAPGEIIWVDFRDKQQFEGPIYLGKVDRKAYSGGFRTTERYSGASTANAAATGKLGASAPAGDSVNGQQLGSQEPSADKRPTRFVLPTTNISVGGKTKTAYRFGREIGQIKVQIWTPSKDNNKLVASDVAGPLHDFSMAMKKELGWELRVNSGFRSNEEQTLLRNKYTAYLKGEGPKADPAARPKYSNHQNGRAVDLSILKNGIRQAIADNKEVFTWMQLNAHRWNFTWAEGKRITRRGDQPHPEPWHWLYLGEVEGLNDSDKRYVERYRRYDKQDRDKLQSSLARQSRPPFECPEDKEEGGGQPKPSRQPPDEPQGGLGGIGAVTL